MNITLNVHDVVRVEATSDEYGNTKWTEVRFYGAEEGEVLLRVFALGADQTKDLPVSFVVRVES